MKQLKALAYLILVIQLFMVQKNAWAEENWDDWGEEDAWEEESTWDVSGFAEASLGIFTKSNSTVQSNQSLEEVRGQLSASRYFGDHFLSAKGELLYDGVLAEWQSDLRELYITLNTWQKLDLKVGRQVLTWGTGDLVFLNDLFPKDWQSFFSGREQSYLKAPSDSVRATYFTSKVNADLILTPKFDPDRYINGERFSFFNPMAQGIIAAPPTIEAETPTNNMQGAEWALRLYQDMNLFGKSAEWAVYGYRGFFKSPVGMTSSTGRAYFPELSVLGASLRRPLLKGIANIEFAHHHSREDSKGTDPWIPNSQNRFLLGYEQELVTRLTLATQYYQERIQNFDQQIANSFTPQYELGPRRHVITTRLTYRAMNDKLTWSMFMFLSPDEDDRYLLPSVSWRVNDEMRVDLGGNYFSGERLNSFLGQFSENSNVYARIRINI